MHIEYTCERVNSFQQIFRAHYENIQTVRYEWKEAILNVNVIYVTTQYSMYN